ncbi:MAG: hypothetical protein IPN53_24745 [Comamonadaceae bacterium]|nr:hypothetical protein [Comamonadaceae bacterium]
MSDLILLGDEAVARAAIDAGITAAYAFPAHPRPRFTRRSKTMPKSTACRSRVSGPPMKKWRWKKASVCPTLVAVPSCR